MSVESDPVDVELDQLRHEARIRRYILRVEPWLLPDGEWAYRAEYPEIDGVVAVASSVLGAIDQVDRMRDAYLAGAGS